MTPEVWNYILSDMAEPFDYLPKAVLAGLIILAVAFRLFFRKNKKQAFVFYLFVIYLIVALEMAFFSRPPGSRTSVNMEILGTWGHGAQGNAYVIENVIMFLPWGILLPLFGGSFQKAWFCTVTAFFASSSLEAVQYLTERGHCQLDDVIMNTLGAFCGWLIWSAGPLLRRIFRAALEGSSSH